MAKYTLPLPLFTVSRGHIYAFEWRCRHAGHRMTLWTCKPNPSEYVLRCGAVRHRSANVHALHLLSQLVCAALRRWVRAIGIIEWNRRDGWGTRMTRTR